MPAAATPRKGVAPATQSMLRMLSAPPDVNLLREMFPAASNAQVAIFSRLIGESAAKEAAADGAGESSGAVEKLNDVLSGAFASDNWVKRASADTSESDSEVVEAWVKLQRRREGQRAVARVEETLERWAEVEEKSMVKGAGMPSVRKRIKGWLEHGAVREERDEALLASLCTWLGDVAAESLDGIGDDLPLEAAAAAEDAGQADNGAVAVAEAEGGAASAEPQKKANAEPESQVAIASRIMQTRAQAQTDALSRADEESASAREGVVGLLEEAARRYERLMASGVGVREGVASAREEAVSTRVVAEATHAADEATLGSELLAVEREMDGARRACRPRCRSRRATRKRSRIASSRVGFITAARRRSSPGRRP